MDIKIRKGEKRDLPSVLALIQELAEYEKAPQEVVTTVESMEKDAFGEFPFFRFFVAEVEGKVIGIAVYFFSYSTWKGRAMYLDDLVVTESMRRFGVGSKLFEALVEEARKIGANRLSWQVLEWNQPAIEFYEKIEAHLDDEWINCKLTKDQINHFKI